MSYDLPVHRFEGTQDDVGGLRGISRAWEAGDKFWGFDDILALLERRSARLYYVTSQDLNRAVDSVNSQAQLIALIKPKWVGAVLFSSVMEDADLIYCFVLPDHRRKGFAKSMLERSMEVLRQEGVRRITLEVRTSNIGAQALYASLGFVTIDRRPRYYGGTEDAIVMQWQAPALAGS